jgi:2-keto-4-pentenoate hydratase
MIVGSACDAAHALLWQHWQHGTVLERLPPELAPVSRADGYRIQAALEGRSAKALFGWKIAATSTAGQAHINVDGPLAGRLLAERAFSDGATLTLGANRMRVVEPEFAFVMGHDLVPRDTVYAVDAVMAAVARMHPALEVPDSRLGDFTQVGAAQLIADNACAHEFVLGPAAPDQGLNGWRKVDLARHTVSARVSGGLQREGSGAAVLGDPRLALTWLVNELSGLGIILRAGCVITTGTCMAPLTITAGVQVTADFGQLGSVSLSIANP